MNMELLPSKNFKTNDLILKLSALSYNILRIIGDAALIFDPSFQHHNKVRTIRIRFKTIINRIINIQYRAIKHARKFTVRFGKNLGIFKIFEKIFNIL